jgi:hypothetical protein
MITVARMAKNIDALRLVLAVHGLISQPSKLSDRHIALADRTIYLQ